MHPSLITTLALTGLLAIPVLAQEPDEVAHDRRPVVVRETVPYPRAVDRGPMTSDQFETASTRLIDARRGYRPYDRYDRGLHGRRIAYRDTFGIIRPESRLAPPREARTGVMTFRAADTQGQTVSTDRAAEADRQSIIIVMDERRQAERDPAERVDMRVRIHKGEMTLPSRSGAVIVTADGTVIEVGD